MKKVYEYGNDIGTALENLEPVDLTQWKPKMQVSDDSDEEIRIIENRQFEIEFKAEYDEYRKRVNCYENNKVKAYALLWERCAKAMKNKIEARTDYQTIRNNPIELLKGIKEHSMNYQENRYSMSIILDAFRVLLSTKQRDGESLQDYTKRFRVARDVLKSHVGGPIILTKLVEATKGYSDGGVEQQDNIREQVFGQFLAYLYLENADRTKYGSILAGLSTQQSLGNDQYPKTITESNNVLSNHKFDVPRANVKKNQLEDKGKDRKNEEKEDEDITLSFAQLEGKCYCCGKAGHKSPSCRYKDKPKDEWAINKAQQSHAQAVGSDSSTVASTSSGQSASQRLPSTTDATASQAGWSGAHVELQFYQASEMRDWILLDNQSSVTIFCNPDMVKNIRPSDSGVMKLTTNGGSIVTSKKADLPQWGEVWFNENAITNIFSYAEMADRYRITYDSNKADEFVVHLPEKDVRFTRMGTNLYIFKPPKSAQVATALLNTVEENKKFYTQRQFDRAKRARDLYNALGTPSVSDFKAILRMNAIADNPVTTEDIRHCRKDFWTRHRCHQRKNDASKAYSCCQRLCRNPKRVV